MANGVAHLLNTRPPHMCYHVEFGRSVLKGVGINTGEPQKLGSTGTPLFWDGRRC